MDNDRSKTCSSVDDFLTIKYRYIFVPSAGIHPVSFCPVYCASKFGVIGFTRSVAPASIQHAFSLKFVNVFLLPGLTWYRMRESGPT